MAGAYDQLMRYVEHMGSTQWIVLVFAVVMFGVLCMRGYGSRSDY